MNVNNFITLFNVRVKNEKTLSPETIVSIVSELVKPTGYKTYDEKIKLVEKTIKSTQKYDYPTPMLYRQLIIDVINGYTPLKIDEADFDTLSANYLLDPILATFKSEYMICEAIMKMMVSDISFNDKNR